MPPARPARAPLRARSRCSTTTSTTGSARTRSRSCCATARAGSPTHPERELIVAALPEAPTAPLTAQALAAPGRGRRSPTPTGPSEARRERGGGVEARGLAERAAAGGGRRRAARQRARGGCSTWAAARASCCRACWPSASSPRSSASTSRTARSRSPRDRLRLDRLPAAQRERIRLLQGVADLPRPAAGRLRRRRRGRGDRAPRPAAPGRLRARAVRVRRAPAHGRPDHAERASTTSASRRCPPGTLRHRDHRFEWTRAEFRGAGRRPRPTGYGYAVRFVPVGPERPRPRRADPDGGLRARERPEDPDVPELSLVVLIGPSGSGKSTFARRHFMPTEVLSSDSCRGLVARRRERPGGDRRRVRGAALHRRASGWRAGG